jgi:hypothetical protein
MEFSQKQLRKARAKMWTRLSPRSDAVCTLLDELRIARFRLELGRNALTPKRLSRAVDEKVYMCVVPESWHGD